MKKLCLTITIAVFLLICSNWIQAQTTQAKLNQVELMKQSIGTWQANAGKDTVEVWEFQQYGKAFIINASLDIKGKKTPLYKNNISFNSNEDKFKGLALWTSGDYATWIGFYTTEKKFSGDFVQDLNPAFVWGKFQIVFENPKANTYTTFNKDGVKTEELKFTKVK